MTTVCFIHSFHSTSLLPSIGKAEDISQRKVNADIKGNLQINKSTNPTDYVMYKGGKVSEVPGAGLAFTEWVLTQISDKAQGTGR